MKKIYLLGQDNVGWSVDKDRQHLERSMQDIGYSITSNPITADVIYAVWWNMVLNWRYFWLRFLHKPIIATVTNDLTHQVKDFEKARKIVNIWVYANHKQKKFLLEHGVPESSLFYNPFYVDEKVFRKLNDNKEELAEKLAIDYQKIKDKTLIGSFQRDSLGADLTKPKWQKNPDLLIEVMKDLDKDKFMLILAGPRRHYIIHKCKELGIDYLFVGNENLIAEMKDDILENNLPLEKINLLYNLVDWYLVSSQSEGGPKAPIEAALSQTPVLSTDVGLAPEFLIPEAICAREQDFIKKINDDKLKQEMTIANYQKTLTLNNYEALKNRVKLILEATS